MIDKILYFRQANCILSETADRIFDNNEYEVVSYDIKKYPDLVQEFNIVNCPTLLFQSNHAIVYRLSGLITQNKIDEIISQYDETEEQK